MGEKESSREKEWMGERATLHSMSASRISPQYVQEPVDQFADSQEFQERREVAREGCFSQQAADRRAASLAVRVAEVFTRPVTFTSMPYYRDPAALSKAYPAVL